MGRRKASNGLTSITAAFPLQALLAEFFLEEVKSVACVGDETGSSGFCWLLIKYLSLS
jgi:hypothetical protein